MKIRKEKEQGTVDLLLSLKEYTGEDEVIDSYEMKSLIDQQPTPKCYKSGLPALDQHLDGFTGGELIAVSGPRKSGKTLFCQGITGDFNQHGARCLWFSYELPAREFIKRFPELPLFVMPKKMKIYSMDWLRDRILESISKYGVCVVFIDHLHFLFDMVQTRNPSIQIGQIIRSLKTMAIELNITIFILCHMVKIDPYEEPTDDKIRDSSFVAQESDVGLMIWRDTKSENEAWLKICYSRRTGVLEKKIKLVKANGLLKELTDRWDV
tara:strand:+ start:1445 stop:2245 length:801 start_codon:yes stop_codon:yes gene_type:complete